MARRRLLTDEHWAGLLALPSDERDVVRHCTLAAEDLAALAIKRADHNRLGCALLLCAMRHPGRVLDVGEVPPASMVAYVARQIGIHPAALRSYPARAQTRREQIAELMRHHGFGVFGRADATRFLSWLTPIAQLNRKPGQLVAMLVEEVRQQRVLLPAPRVLELIVHHARTRGERITHRALTIDLTAAQSAALDGLLGSSGGPTRMAWLRQTSSSPASRNLLGLIERMRTVRTLGINRDREGAVPASAFDALAGEGLRMTAQHLRDLTQPRRAATMAAAVIRLETELADAALLMFDKLMGGLARKSERRTMESAASALRDAQSHLRVLARAGRAMIAAHEGDADPVAAVDLAVGWARFLRAVAEAEGLARPETLDVRAELVRRWPTMRQFAPALLDAFEFEGAPSASSLLKAAAVLREGNSAGKRTLPTAALPFRSASVARLGGRPGCAARCRLSSPIRPRLRSCRQTEPWTAGGSARAHPAPDRTRRPRQSRSFAEAGVPSCWTRTASRTAGPGRCVCCPNFATDCAPAMSGFTAAGATRPYLLHLARWWAAPSTLTTWRPTGTRRCVLPSRSAPVTRAPPGCCNACLPTRRQNGLAVALREIGRIERTLFTLDWIRDPALRRRANAGLNKGEARNALARAIFFHRLGELRDRSFENQVYRASGLNLLVAAVILWNTRYLQASFDTLGQKGNAPAPALLRHVAPLGWEHISLTGDYIWTEDAQPAPGLLRPLREKPSMLAA